MTWFKNLPTIAKLMIGFGILALLMGVVGYEGFSGMGAINDKLATLYERDMTGLSAIKDLNTTVAQIGRDARGTMIFTDKAEMEREKLKVDSLYPQLDEEMAQCRRIFTLRQARRCSPD